MEIRDAREQLLDTLDTLADSFSVTSVMQWVIEWESAREAHLPEPKVDRTFERPAGESDE
jgi:hypothetical protein